MIFDHSTNTGSEPDMAKTPSEARGFSVDKGSQTSAIMIPTDMCATGDGVGIGSPPEARNPFGDLRALMAFFPYFQSLLQEGPSGSHIGLSELSFPRTLTTQRFYGASQKVHVTTRGTLSNEDKYFDAWRIPYGNMLDMLAALYIGREDDLFYIVGDPEWERYRNHRWTSSHGRPIHNLIVESLFRWGWIRLAKIPRNRQVYSRQRRYYTLSNAGQCALWRSLVANRHPVFRNRIWPRTLNFLLVFEEARLEGHETLLSNEIQHRLWWYTRRLRRRMFVNLWRLRKDPRKRWIRREPAGIDRKRMVPQSRWSFNAPGRKLITEIEDWGFDGFA